MLEGEKAEVQKARKRSQATDARGSTSVATGEYEKALEDAEKKRREIIKLQVSKNKSKEEVRKLRKELKSKDANLEKEIEQKLAVETQLRGSNIQLVKAVEEIVRLKAQLKEIENAHVPIPLPECNECKGLIKQCQYLKDTLYQKDVVIESFVGGRDREKTKKLFKETKDWSVKFFKQGGPLYYVEMEDTL